VRGKITEGKGDELPAVAAVGAFLLAEAAVLPAFADAPVTFNVTVNVSSLMPDSPRSP